MSRRSRSKLVLRLSPWKFRLWWLCVVAAHCLLGMFYRHLYLTHQTVGIMKIDVIMTFEQAGLGGSTPESGLDAPTQGNGVDGSTHGGGFDGSTPGGGGLGGSTNTGGLDEPTSGGGVDGSSPAGGSDPTTPEGVVMDDKEDSRRLIKAITAIYAAIAACHALEVFLACVQSFYFRQLCFQAPEGSSSVLDSVRVLASHVGTFRGGSGSSQLGGMIRRWWQYIEKPLSLVKRWARRLNYILEYHSTAVVLVLEAIEVGCQTAQAYRMSYNVSVVWMNRLYALATVGNCWSSPCLHLMFRRHPTTERVMAMVVDALFNAFQSVVIPWMILYPSFTKSLIDFQAISWTPYLSQLAFYEADDNIQQLYPSSWLNVFVIGAPCFLMIGYISSIKRSVLCGTPAVVPTSLMVRKVQQASSVSEKETANSDGLVPVGPTAPTNTRNHGSKSFVGRKRMWISRILHSWLGIWGFVVLACHLYALHKGNQAVQAGCLGLMRPWLTTEYVCSLANISCAMNHITGRRDELHEILEKMAASDLQELIISDCIELEMPPRLQAFPNLTRLVIYNSSISSWEMDAALTADHHAKLLSLSIIETNMSAVPPALLHSNLPPYLLDLVFSGTNLTALPSNAHEYWTMVSLFCLEVSPGVTEFPSTLALCPLISQISLVGNSITTIPEDVYAQDRFFIVTLDLSSNPLSSLPSVINPSQFPLFRIKNSDVEYLPDTWIDLPEIAPIILASGAKLCAHMEANESVFAAENSMVPVLNAPQWYSVQAVTVRCEVGNNGTRWFGNVDQPSLNAIV